MHICRRLFRNRFVGVLNSPVINNSRTDRGKKTCELPRVSRRIATPGDSPARLYTYPLPRRVPRKTLVDDVACI